MKLFVYPLNDYYTLTTTWNPIRLIECALCVGCLICATFIITGVTSFTITLLVIIGFTAIAFSLITLIDIVAGGCMRPIFWHPWIQIAMAGGLFCFLSGGILVMADTTKLISIIGIVFFSLAGTAFLADVVAILRMLTKERTDVQPREVEEAAQREEQVQKVQAAPRPVMARQMSPMQSPRPEMERSQGTLDRTPRPRKPCACPPPRRTASPGVTSHGGTFPMSKDLAPLSSQSPRKATGRGPCPKDPRIRSCQCPESRTVAVSTRLVPKACRPHSTPSSSTRDSSKDLYLQEADNVQQQRDTSQVMARQHQQQPQPSMVYHSYIQNACTCGKMHYQQATTVKGDVGPMVPPIQEVTTPRRTLKECDCGSSYPDQRNRRNGLDVRDNTSADHQSLQTISEYDPSVETCPAYVIKSEFEEVQAPYRPFGGVIEEEEEDERQAGFEAELGPICVPNMESVRICSAYKKRSQCSQRPCSEPYKYEAQTDDDEVQTSETRMIRARDLENLPKLPGSADRSPPMSRNWSRK